MSVLGIDLSSSPKRTSAYALVNGDGELHTVDGFSTTDELLSFLDTHNPSLITIDAPISLPLGLDCLEEDHDCAHSLNKKGRASEQELAERRIGCFFTTKKSIIKTMIYRALELKQVLDTKGYQVIEVYPYATKVILFGGKIPPKNSVKGLAFLRKNLSGLVKGAEHQAERLNHDQCDAILAAYTGHLHIQNKTDSLGVPEEGFIVIPSRL